ncbi:MAG TPA: energy transducer TonB [Candidatus Eisenbacteria bacterium]
MSLGLPDPRRLERSYYRRVELSILIALAIHAAAMVLAPPYVPRPYKLDERPLRLVLAAGGGETAGLAARAAPSEAPPTAARPLTKTTSPTLTRELRYTPEAVQSLPPAAPSGSEGGSDRAGQGAPGAAGEAGPYGSAPEVFYTFDVPPRVVRSVVPEYPAAAKSQGGQGTVVLNANVDERGRVKRVWVVQATAPEILIQAATDALYRFEFTPGSARGIPVKCTVAVPFNFRLNVHL